ncbi:hypothetical protein EMCRGX_G009757 [Ephydatia muelleri]
MVRDGGSVGDEVNSLEGDEVEGDVEALENDKTGDLEGEEDEIESLGNKAEGLEDDEKEGIEDVQMEGEEQEFGNTNKDIYNSVSLSTDEYSEYLKKDKNTDDTKLRFLNCYYQRSLLSVRRTVMVEPNARKFVDDLNLPKIDLSDVIEIHFVQPVPKVWDT